MKGRSVEVLEARVAELERALAEAREDTERIDWLEHAARYYQRQNYGDEELGFMVDDDGTVLGGCRGDGYEHQTIREAIDAARKQEV